MEWLVKPVTTHAPLSSAPLAAKLTSSATETIDTVDWYCSAVSGTSKPVVCDVYELADALYTQATDLVATRYRPNADGAVKTNVQDQAAGTTNIYQAVDEVSESTADYISGDGSGTPVEWTFQVGSAAFTGRVKRVLLVGYAQATSGSFQLTPYVRIGSTDYLGTPWTVGTADTFFSYSWSLNPATDLPWTQAEVASFDTSTIEFGFKWSANSTGRRLYQAFVEVQYITENRVATGSLTPAVGWNTFSLATPAGVDNWAKVNGTDYLVVLSAPSGTGSPNAQVPLLNAEEACPHAGYQGYAPTADTGWAAITALNTADTRIPGLVLTTTAPAVSADSQPYARTLAVTIHSNRTFQQEFTPAANAAVERLRLRVQQVDTPTDSLLAKIRQRSDDAQVGGTATITADDFKVGPSSWAGDPVVIETTFASAANVVSGTQYYLELSSAVASSSSEQWHVSYLTSASGTGNAVGFGGTTDRLTQGTSPGTESSDTDYPAMLATVPVTPANFGGVTDPNQGSCHPVAKLAWDETALVGDFDRYELDRLNQDGVTWDRIAEITDETLNEFFDGDGRRAKAESYRVRVRRTDQAVSAWSATIQVTADHPDLFGCDPPCDVILTTNEDLTLSVCGMPEGPTTYTFPKDQVTLELYDTDYAVAFTELEERGDEFGYKLVLYADDDVNPHLPAVSGRRAFDGIEALRDAQADPDINVTTVTVLDPFGNRWYTQMRIGQAVHSEPGVLHTADVTFRELTRTPPVVTLP